MARQAALDPALPAADPGRLARPNRDLHARRGANLDTHSVTHADTEPVCSSDADTAAHPVRKPVGERQPKRIGIERSIAIAAG